MIHRGRQSKWWAAKAAKRVADGKTGVARGWTEALSRHNRDKGSRPGL